MVSSPKRLLARICNAEKPNRGSIVSDNSLSRRTMASSKKTKEEREKEKSKAKQTKPTEQENKKAKTSSKKPNNNNKKKKGIGNGNGNIRKPEDEVIIIPTSSTDSQEESDNEQEKRRLEATNERKKSKKPNKSSKKQEELDYDDDDDEEEDKVDAKVCNFPMSRIRRIIKSQGSDFLITGDAVFLVNKATDKFLEQFSEDAYACCSKDRKKSVAYNHLASVVSKKRRYDFLSDSVPEKIKVEDALAERKLAEAGDR